MILESLGIWFEASSQISGAPGRTHKDDSEGRSHGPKNKKNKKFRWKMAGSRLPATFPLSYLVLPISADVLFKTSIRWLNLPAASWCAPFFWHLDFNKEEILFDFNTKQLDSPGVIQLLIISCWWLNDDVTLSEEIFINWSKTHKKRILQFVQMYQN